MATRVPVQPALLNWAADRAGVSEDALRKRFPKWDQWLGGETKPTLRQLEEFAKATKTPVGYLFLPKPPMLSIPIPDYRTPGSERLDQPSPDLLDTIHLCQQRQEWYRAYMKSLGGEPLAFVGSATVQNDIEPTARMMRERMGFDIMKRLDCRTWEEALTYFRQQVDAAGVLVMTSGIVGGNTRRKLDPAEFRGFALADPLAPVVFVNGADTKAGQMFTLAHELAHLWLGESALSDATPSVAGSRRVERWCNRVAAELLVPLAEVREAFDPAADLLGEVNKLARLFKVSTLVILRRVLDAGEITRRRFDEVYAGEVARLKKLSARRSEAGGGGDWYLTAPVRVSNRFAKAVLTSTFEGRSSFTDAKQLIGCRKVTTLRNLGEALGVGA